MDDLEHNRTLLSQIRIMVGFPQTQSGHVNLAENVSDGSSHPT